jgi:hypothetical protein
VPDDYFRELKLAIRSDNPAVATLEHQQLDTSGEEIVFDLHKFDTAKKWSQVTEVLNSGASPGANPTIAAFTTTTVSLL